MAKTVLAVDDSRSMRQMVSFTLKGAGYDVIEAVDGEDGLVKSKGSTVHLVLTDQNMPNMDGLSLIKAGWLVKPFDPAKLLMVVRKVIG